MTPDPLNSIIASLSEAQRRARETLATALRASGPSWAGLADAIENGSNYENDTVIVTAALSAVMAAMEHDREEMAEVLGALKAIVNTTSVGQHHRPVSERSAYGNYPAKLYYRAKNAIAKAEGR